MPSYSGLYPSNGRRSLGVLFGVRGEDEHNKAESYRVYNSIAGMPLTDEGINCPDYSFLAFLLPPPTT